MQKGREGGRKGGREEEREGGKVVLIARLMGSIIKHDEHAEESEASARRLPVLII